MSDWFLCSSIIIVDKVVRKRFLSGERKSKLFDCFLFIYLFIYLYMYIYLLFICNLWWLFLTKIVLNFAVYRLSQYAKSQTFGCSCILNYTYIFSSFRTVDKLLLHYKIHQLMPYKETLRVCSDSHTKHINILRSQNVECFNISSAGTWSNYLLL